MNISTILGRHFHSPIPHIAIVTLIGLACSAPAFCGEIHSASAAGDLAKVKTLLKDNPELVSSKDNTGMTPLHWTAGFDRKDVAELLLGYKADVNAKDNVGHTPLHIAAGTFHKSMVEFLLANKADVNANNNGVGRPLHYAVRHGYKDVVELLLAQKKDHQKEQLHSIC
jgi:ankyrin repeat protein